METDDRLFPMTWSLRAGLLISIAFFGSVAVLGIAAGGLDPGERVVVAALGLLPCAFVVYIWWRRETHRTAVDANGITGLWVRTSGPWHRVRRQEFVTTTIPWDEVQATRVESRAGAEGTTVFVLAVHLNDGRTGQVGGASMSRRRVEAVAERFKVARSEHLRTLHDPDDQSRR
jgi:hypothetical protein